MSNFSREVTGIFGNIWLNTPSAQLVRQLCLNRLDQELEDWAWAPALPGNQIYDFGKFTILLVPQFS